ncbi:MAG: hypothetical protein ACI89Z_001495 [Porticoccus sp.]
MIKLFLKSYKNYSNNFPGEASKEANIAPNAYKPTKQYAVATQTQHESGHIYMTKNDILRRIRYTFNFSDSKMRTIFGLADHKVSRKQISDFLKKEDDPDYQSCSDVLLATFLNGLIDEKRGKKEGAQPEPETRLTNNIIFMKLKIALNLKAEDILEIMGLVDFRLSQHELSAFFRKTGHKHYRECKDQVLRNFLNGLQIKYRDDSKPYADQPKTGFVWNPLPGDKVASDENE